MGTTFCSSAIAKLLICFLLVGCIACELFLFVVEGFDEQGPETESPKCDLFKGSWVFDDSQTLYYDALTCPFISPDLNCQKNGRPDNLYLKYRWNPIQCQLSRFDGPKFLQKLSGKKIMFVGDSLGNNQWQSLACMLHSAAPSSNYTLVNTDQLAALSFPENRLSVMFLKNGFLVDLVVENVGRVLKLDSISRTERWRGIDVLIFDSYHWWTHTGRSKTWDYYRIGDKLIKDMDPMVAFETALTTWAHWVDSNVEPVKTRVFFQGISSVHYRGEGWNEPTVQNCSGQTKPIEGADFPGQHYPGEAVIKNVLNNMKTPVYLLDIALLTQLRKDGHPSKYVKGGLDCSHWCLAGVPDTWNEILYTILLDY